MLSWLQEDPDASAVVLLNRLKSAHPDRFSDTALAHTATQSAAVAWHQGQKAGLRCGR